MAILQMTYLSEALFRTVPVSVYLPCDKIAFEEGSYQMRPGQKFKTLYLLHGMIGCHIDWLIETRLRRWAEERELAVVMPSGDNAFYIDSPLPNNDYGRFIGEELVEMTRRMFPLSDRREDTFIAGLSMGGYGALRNALVYPETFSYAAGFSSGLHFFLPGAASIRGEQLVFGDPAEAAKSDKNPYVALSNAIEQGKELPKFYLSCGTEDMLMPSNIAFRDELVRRGADVTWDEQPGGHDWDFWDAQLKKMLDWLPLENGEIGLGSGHVLRKTE